MRTVVLVPNWLGDAVMALPVLSALRGEGEVVGFGDGKILELLEGLGHLDRSVLHDRRGRHAGVQGVLRAMQELRALRPDRVVSLVPSERAAALLWGSGAAERWTSSRPGLARWAGTRWTDGTPCVDEHLVDRWLTLIDRPTAGAPACRLAENWLGHVAGREPTSRRLVVAPGATFGPTKRWPLERFATVVNQLRSRFDEIVVVGGGDPGEMADCATLARSCGGQNLAGRTGIGELAALLGSSSAFVGNDSGPMHLAAALGVATVGVFTSTSPGWTAPRGPRATAVGGPDLPCAPCFAPQCRENFECMDAVPVDSVARELEALLERPQLDRRPVLWVDRDGTLLDDPGYLSDPEGVRLLPGAAAALAELEGRGWRLVLVTNQSGIGRGYMDGSDVDAVHEELRRRLAEGGAHLEHIELCPHAPSAECDCRKPRTGMIDRAREQLRVHPLAPQFVLGDKEADLWLARAAGARAVLVRTGEGRATEAALEASVLRESPVVDDAGSAVDVLTGWVGEAGS